MLDINQALKRMRELTKGGVPFSIEYISCDMQRGKSEGLKVKSKVMLRTGLSQEMSDKHNSLIAYIDLSNNQPRQFYLPLLMKFNNIEIK